MSEFDNVESENIICPHCGADQGPDMLGIDMWFHDVFDCIVCRKQYTLTSTNTICFTTEKIQEKQDA